MKPYKQAERWPKPIGKNERRPYIAKYNRRGQPEMSPTGDIGSAPRPVGMSPTGDIKTCSNPADRLAELEAVATEARKGAVKNLQTFRETLLTVHDEELYVDRYGTWERYCKERWNFSRSHSYRLLKVTRFDLAFQPFKEIRDKKDVTPERKFRKKEKKVKSKIIAKTSDAVEEWKSQLDGWQESLTAEDFQGLLIFLEGLLKSYYTALPTTRSNGEKPREIDPGQFTPVALSVSDPASAPVEPAPQPTLAECEIKFVKHYIQKYSKDSDGTIAGLLREESGGDENENTGVITGGLQITAAQVSTIRVSMTPEELAEPMKRGRGRLRKVVSEAL
jgi:hypothetical protein